MKKWYEEDTNKSTILSCRIRLARNFSGCRFPSTMSDEEKHGVIEKLSETLGGYEGEEKLKRMDMDGLDTLSKRSLVDRHLISPEMAAEKRPACVFVSESEKTGLMAMEEDHLRIQAMESGDNIEKAYERAAEFDGMVDESMDYAFDKQWGYLTSCPTNIGTGMRASFMLHLPYLEAMGQIRNIADSLAKFGYTIRGTFGEGSESYGSVYQISNQITLGMREEDILNGIQALAKEIESKEGRLRQGEIASRLIDAEDVVWRVYGVLTNARKMTEKEAITNLSLLKTGVMAGIFDLPLPNIYDLIVNIRSATLSENYNIKNNNDIPIARAEYLRKKLLGR